jgi:uncharacterized protein (TIGR03382 family)
MVRVRIAAALVAAFLLAQVATAEAYDPQYTHRWLTRQAALHLIELYPGQYDELLPYIDALTDGAEHEDDAILDGDSDPTTSRLMRHFYRPTDGAGLTFEFGSFPSSYEWGGTNNALNAWDWTDAMLKYRRGDYEAAFFALGHVSHLLQDLTVPAHTHLDVHGPPYGDDYEGYCSDHMLSDRESLLPTPNRGTAIPEFTDVEDAWKKTSIASFWRNMYPGNLSNTEAAVGVVSNMYPDLRFHWLQKEWVIDAVGMLGADFQEHRPGWFYFKKTMQPADIDMARYNPSDFLDVDYGTNDTRAPMAELMARDLVPVAILHSAALMKHFLDTARDQEPLPPEDDMELPDAASAGCNTTSHRSSPIWLVLAAFAVVLLRRRN